MCAIKHLISRRNASLKLNGTHVPCSSDLIHNRPFFAQHKQWNSLNKPF